MVKVKPGRIYIGKSEQTEKLYELERRRGEAIRATATEWARFMREARGGDELDFWGEAMPQQLFDILDTYADGAVEAAIAFLEANGYIVTDSVKPPSGG